MCTTTQEVIDYRQTFLRFHIHQLRTLPHDDPTWDGIQAIRDLHQAGPGQMLTLEWFFGSGLYRPVRLSGVDQPNEANPSLVDLLQRLREQAPIRRTGILLQGGGGSGKTISLLSAFLACLPQPNGGMPPLGCHVPCWIGRLDSTFSPGAWPELLAHVASQGAPGPLQPEQVRQWVDLGPPLLLLCDLDAIPAAQREAVVGCLRSFCCDQIHRGGCRSLCVIATSGFRSTERECQLDHIFVRHRLEPWPHHVALSYAASWGQILQDHHLPAHPALEEDVFAHIDCLPGFVHQLVTLPALPPAPRPEGELLHAWVRSRPPAPNIAETTRLALWRFHGTPIPEEMPLDDVRTLLEDPAQTPTFQMPPDLEPSVWRRHGCLYFANPSPTPLSWDNLVQGSPYLRAQGDSVRFVSGLEHYFEGVMATRFWWNPFLPSRAPGHPVLDQRWHQAVLRRWSQNPTQFVRAAFLLGGVLAGGDLRNLLRDYLRTPRRSQGMLRLIRKATGTF